MEILLSDGRRAYSSGCDQILIAEKPRSNTIAAALLGGIIAALAVMLLISIFGGKKRR